MLLERSFRVGDSVKIDSFGGRSPTFTPLLGGACGQRTQVSRAEQEMFMVNRVEISLESKRVAFNTKLQIDYASDVDKAAGIDGRCGATQPRVLKDPAPMRC